MIGLDTPPDKKHQQTPPTTSNNKQRIESDSILSDRTIRFHDDGTELNSGWIWMELPSTLSMYSYVTWRTCAVLLRYVTTGFFRVSAGGNVPVSEVSEW